MRVGEREPNQDQSELYSESDAAKLSGLTKREVSCCVSEGLVVPVTIDGMAHYTGPDLLKLKLVKAILSVQTIEDAVAKLFEGLGHTRSRDSAALRTRSEEGALRRAVARIRNGQ